MRAYRAGLVALIVFVLSAGSASASYTLDLIWADTGNSHIDLESPGDPTAPSSGTLCHTGARSGAGAGRCLLVRLTAEAQFTAAIMTLGWDAASTGLAIDFAPFRSIGQFGASGIPGAAGVSPSPASSSGCSPQCDSAFGSFGVVSAAAVPAGTYVIGSVNIDTSGVLPFADVILAFLRPGIDKVTDKNFAVAPVQLNPATLFIAPEPGTAALLGLGIFALAWGGRPRQP